MPITRQVIETPVEKKLSSNLDYLALESGTPGPKVFLTAVLHGDEIGGGAVVEKIFELLEKRGLKKGSLSAFPCINVEGREKKTRNLPGGEDLNRVFPGKADGSETEKLAALVFEKIKGENPELVIDLHNDWIQSIPYTIVSRHDTSAAAKARDAAVKSNLPAVTESGEGIPGALSDMLTGAGIPAITMEVGGTGAIREKDVAHGIEAILNILEYFDMLEPEGEAQ